MERRSLQELTEFQDRMLNLDLAAREHKRQGNMRACIDIQRSIVLATAAVELCQRAGVEFDATLETHRTHDFLVRKAHKIMEGLAPPARQEDA